jgi:predicted nucleotidyltransferase component of viral defense system
MKEESFALKGGTAINLFVRDMPRLSVDIDLTWLPFDERATALDGITDALRRVKEQIEKTIPQTRVKLAPQSDGQETKLNIQTPSTQIKVEVNTLIRGSLFPPVRMRVGKGRHMLNLKLKKLRRPSNREVFLKDF